MNMQHQFETLWQKIHQRFSDRWCTYLKNLELFLLKKLFRNTTRNA